MTTPTRQPSTPKVKWFYYSFLPDLALWSLGIIALLASLTLFLLRHYDYKLYQGPYKIDKIIAEESFSYIGLLDHDKWSSHERPSDAEVLENGEPLKGKQGSTHSDIRQIGLGRYSFWHKNIYFSTSDNSDPRTNGRQYEIRKRLMIPENLVIISFALSLQLLFGAILFSIHKRRGELSRAGLTLLRLAPLVTAAMVLLLSYIFYEARLFPEKPQFLWKREEMTDFQPELGKAFTITRTPAEERREQIFSVGKFTEDGYLLGPGNAVHDTIRQSGGGAYSIWKNFVYFSTSDGSDPRTNGRSYVLFTPPARNFLTKSLIVLASISFTLLLVFPLFTYPKFMARGWLHHAISLLLLVFQTYLILPYAIHSQMRTWVYGEKLDLARLESSSMTFEAGCEDASQTARRIETLREELGGVVRSKALRDLFLRLTRGAQSDTERHRRVLEAVQKLSIHSNSPSNYSNGIEIRDPLLLLELGNMWCGQAAKLAVDLFEAGGYKGRLVQLGTHIVAEIFYGGDWHYFDADLFGNGEVVLKDDGEIPSIRELGSPELRGRLDALAAYQESLLFNCLEFDVGLAYPSYYYFSELAYRSQPERPGYHYKETPPASADLLLYSYGWMTLRYEADESIIRGAFPRQEVPTIPQIEEVAVDDNAGSVRLAFRSKDKDGDLVRYRVFLSERSRGWNYAKFAGRDDLRRFMSEATGGTVDHFERAFQTPPDDLGQLIVAADSPNVTIDLHGKRRVYVTIMPVDAYGESIGRKIFPVSNELRIDLN